ncbi:hypothetical protein [Changpingibacter yushuensis]|uniref:hypothetical protein n=1 Tax=Changpingibacter yushuensis TaxID=2758440 RepID=UPI0015F44C60|nr:hypothetical protein [Changpingibacter yushuensis]
MQEAASSESSEAAPQPEKWLRDFQYQRRAQLGPARRSARTIAPASFQLDPPDPL